MCDVDVLKLLRFKTFMYFDGVTLCDVYVMKLIRYSPICYVTLTICDATISGVLVVLGYVLLQYGTL